MVYNERKLQRGNGMKFITITISNIRYLVFEDGSKVKIPENSVMGEFLFYNAEKIEEVSNSPKEVSDALINNGSIDVKMKYGSISFIQGVPDVVIRNVNTENFHGDPSNISFYDDICE